MSHVYTSNGNFIARVVVTTLENCQDTVYLQLPIVVTGPTALFNSPTPANCAPSIVEFSDQSLYPVTWQWQFGDGSSSTVQNPIKLLIIYVYLTIDIFIGIFFLNGNQKIDKCY